jgi:hypothetical protein
MLKVDFYKNALLFPLVKANRATRTCFCFDNNKGINAYINNIPDGVGAGGVGAVTDTSIAN